MLLRFFAVLLICILFSCSNSLPDIEDLTAITVFDFNTAKSTPQVRFSVFVETSENVRRADSICVSFLEKTISDDKIQAADIDSSYEWHVNNPELIEYSKKNFLGYSNFQGLINGKYNFEYYNVDGKTCNLDFSINYPEEFLSSTAEDFPDIMTDSYTEKIAVYSVNGTLLYFGKKESSWKRLSAIKRKYPDAAYFRICYANNSNNYVCFMPSESLEKEAENTSEDGEVN
ncbi:MAG: hypothetical protein K6F69_10470 [Treponema sp.]|nr:hypothetical protein [Treponema sp.]